MPPRVELLDPRTIEVGSRTRKVLGSTTGLAASIARYGLLHPVVVDADHRLIAGQRRLVAWQKVHGCEPIPASVIAADDPLGAEVDENVCRLDLRPRERLAVADHMQALAKANPERFGKPPKGEGPAWLAAKAVGWSRPTLTKARIVHDVAQGKTPGAVMDQNDRYLFDEETVPDLKKRAQGVQEELQSHGHVNRAYQELREAAERIQARKMKAPEDPSPTYGIKQREAALMPGDNEVWEFKKVVERWYVVASINPESLAIAVQANPAASIILKEAQAMEQWFNAFFAAVSRGNPAVPEPAPSAKAPSATEEVPT